MIKKLEFKDIKTTYPSTFLFKDKDKKYSVDGVLDGEDISVEIIDSKAKLISINKESKERIRKF